MVTDTTTGRTQPPAQAVAAPARARVRVSPELAGYALLALVLGVLLWRRASQVDGFYLDEWFYVRGAEYIWSHFPGAVLGTIPEWNRGPQRGYSLLLAGPWSTLSSSTAFTLTHLMNVVLLVSGVIPTALFARRVIATPLLRVLAVTLAVGVPWLTISAHLLTENLAFPVYLWAAYLIVRTAESPTFVNQVLAIGSIALLGFVRLNLAPVFAVLVLAVVVAEWGRRRTQRDVPLGTWLLKALKREAVVTCATVLAAVAAIVLLRRGSASLGAYGGFTFTSISDGLFGAKAELTRHTMLTYARSLVVGSFVLPMAMGLGAGLAALCGRLGRSFVVPAIAALGGLMVVLTGVSIWTAGAALEDRYVFYTYAPVAVFAVAALEHLPRLRRWVAAGAALTLWALVTGYVAASLNAGHFFASPPGAFWSRVVAWRLQKYEGKLLGWTLLGRPGWLLIAIGLALLVWVVAASRTRERAVAALLTAALAVCALCQIVSMDYDYKQELYGTRDAAGGIALGPGHDRDREDWLDARIPDGVTAGVLPGVIGLDGVYGGQERISFWNREVGITVGTQWNGSPVPAPPGFQVVATSTGPDGLARWDGTLPSWLAAFRDDPRIQVRGSLVAKSPTSHFGLYRTTPAHRAVWTGTGLDGDGAVLKGRPAHFVLDRVAAPGARKVTLKLHAPDGASAPLRWRVTRDGRNVAKGRLAPGTDAFVKLVVPSCGGGTCGLTAWDLMASGHDVATPFPAYGAPGPPRPLLLYVQAAEIR